ACASATVGAFTFAGQPLAFDLKSLIVVAAALSNTASSWLTPGMVPNFDARLATALFSWPAPLDAALTTCWIASLIPATAPALNAPSAPTLRSSDLACASATVGAFTFAGHPLAFDLKSLIVVAAAFSNTDSSSETP